jgi:hypothetical protein
MQPRVTVEQVQHLLSGADAHIDSHNQAKVQKQMMEALVQAVLLLAQEVDQLTDILAVQAKLKRADEITIT